ncbi:MAG: DUF2630 family protein [Nocardioidaceae bacterium]
MEDSGIIARVDELVAEEHELRSGSALTDEQRARLAHVEQDLDQCWDLLRQRRARREAHEDPDAATPRPHSQVDSYLQ